MHKLTPAALMVLVLAAVACGGGNPKSAAPRTTTTTTQPTTTTVNLADVVQAYVDDFNRGDVDATVAHFSADAEFITPLGGCSPCVGRDAIRQKLAGAIAAKSQIAITNPTTSGDTVTAGVLSSPQFPAGIQRAIGPFTATVRGGLIVRATAEYDASDPQTAALLALVNGPPPPSS